MWNWNTYDAGLITKLAYNIFDVDGCGVLDMAECDALLRMVYETNRADKELLAKMDVNGDGEVSAFPVVRRIPVGTFNSSRLWHQTGLEPHESRGSPRVYDRERERERERELQNLFARVSVALPEPFLDRCHVGNEGDTRDRDTLREEE